MSRSMPMTDARLDRVAAAWHREYEAWGSRRDDRWVIYRHKPEAEGLITEETMEIILTLKGNRFDADAWLNTLRNRAAARVALEAAKPLRRATHTSGKLGK